ncbi:MAG: hypothetical protein JO215_10095 [Ktedonobacteraceae bacterium]|nr:hypothetical protein [Ktedonobacteraceae bacterium]
MKSIQGLLLRRCLPLLLPVLAGLVLWSTSFVAHSTPQMQGAAAPPSDWPTYNYNLAASGDNTAETALTTTTFPNLKVQWTAHGANGISAQPIEVGNIVYWESWDDNMHATTLNGTNTGKDIWTRNLSVTTGGQGCNPKSVRIASTAA